MKLEIITPNMHLHYDNVHYVSLPSIQGECGILPQHVHAAIALQKGVLQYKEGNATTTTSYPISDGVAIVKENVVRVLTESITL